MPPTSTGWNTPPQTHLVKFSGCESAPNATDERIEAQLLAEASSFDALDIDQDSANHKDRTRYLLRAVPSLLVYVTAHRSMVGYPDLSVNVQGPLATLIDVLLSKLLQFTLPHNQRYAASTRLSMIHECLEEECYLVYPRLHTDEALQVALRKEFSTVTTYVNDKLLHARCGEPLAFLNEERRILDIFSFIPTNMMNFNASDAIDTTSTSGGAAATTTIISPSPPWKWNPKAAGAKQ